MRNRKLNANYAKYAKGKVCGVHRNVSWNFFRIFRVFRGCKNSFQSGQRRLTSVAALIIFATCVVVAQSTNDVPPLRPALSEIPPTVWEQHGVLIIVLSSLGVVLLGAVIWRLLQPKPPVPVPIEIQTRNELELLKLPTEDGKTISRVSQVLKHYFAVAFELPTGEMTTAEFSRAVASSEKVGSELATNVSDFLRQCDEQKFSPTAGIQTSACSRALELFQEGEARRTELRQVAQPK